MRSIKVFLFVLLALAVAVVPNLVFLQPAQADTIEVRVAASTDDCRMRWSGSAWEFSATGGSIVGYTSATAYKYGGGYHFLGITIPQGSTITTAYLVLTAVAADSNDDVNSVITGEDVDNAATFSTIEDYQARRGTVVGGANDNFITTAHAHWDAIADWSEDESGADTTSPELKTIIQEIVNRAGWASGNALVLFWDDHAGTSTATNNTDRGACNYENSTTKCALLHIEYTLPAVPTVTSSAATSVEETTATLNGEITNTGGASVVVTERGFDWDIDTGAPYANVWTESSIYGTGTFDHGVTTLTKGELYYFRAKALNGGGWGYSSELTFLTKPDPPSAFIATTAGETQIDLSWTNGTGSDLTYIRGKLGSTPTNRTDGDYSWNGAGTSVSHTGLSAGQHWYYIAWSYCTEGGLTQYSDTPDLTADAWTFTPPTLITGTCQGFGRDWGTVQGIMVDDEDGPCTQVGFDYGLTTACSDDSWEKTGSYADGSVFIATLTGLDPGCVYYYKAKAYNGIWGYGVVRMFSTTGSATIYEYLNTGGDGQGADIYGNNWAAEQFTVTDTSHTVTYIRLYLKRTLAPGTVTVSIRHADGSSNPTGTDLCSATLDGSAFSTNFTWYQFNVTEISLEPGSYAVVVRAVAGDDSNDIQWKWLSTGGVTVGEPALARVSTDGGITWGDASSPAADFYFEIWGYSCIRINSAAVFEDYLEEGDLLFTTEYVNVYPPYYPNSICSSYFVIQLVDTDGVTVLAQTVCEAWGDKPGSIYLSADESTPITRGAQYYIKLYGTFTGNPVASYQLQGTDWLGGDPVQLDNWVIATAHSIATYYDRDLTAYLSGREVLNQEGGVVFTTGIKMLDSVRPNLFQFTVVTPGYEPSTGENPWEDIAWEDEVGPGLASVLNTMGGWWGMGGRDFAGFGLIGLYLLMACGAVYFGETKGHFNVGGDVSVGAGLAIPFTYVGAELGLLDFAWIAVPGSAMALGLVYTFWLSRT